jgi:hypothetical protein
MAEKVPSGKKGQISLEDYLKVKEKHAKGKLQLHIPWLVRFIIAVPAGYLLFLILYFVVYLRFVAEH